ncbi:hypothetical protein HY572_05090 [Candidatus Micrarchaeota archaeon]|nr:hypothetical protein [Candidatus Micrarchaeota archaeon]
MKAAQYTVFTDKGTGSVSVSDDVLTIQAGRTVRIKTTYVISVEKTGDLALNKVQVQISYYDLFGNKESVSVAMHESDYRGLKKALGK